MIEELKVKVSQKYLALIYNQDIFVKRGYRKAKVQFCGIKLESELNFTFHTVY